MAGSAPTALRARPPPRLSARIGWTQRVLLGVSLLLLVSFFSHSAAAFARIDPPSPYYVTGYLTWADGKGGIAWAKGTSQDDDVRPYVRCASMDSACQPTVQRANAEMTVHGESSSKPTDDTFISEPLRETIHVNVSRSIEITFFLRGGGTDDGRACGTTGTNDLDPELYINDQLVARGYSYAFGRHMSYGNNWGYNEQDSDRAESDWAGAGGYGAPAKAPYCYYTHRIPCECSEIPANAVLKLRALRLDYSNGDFPYGLKADHQSFIRIPYYSTDELYFRRAIGTGGPGAPESPEADSPSPEASILMAALLLLPPVAARATGSKRGAALGLLAFLVLSGCIGTTVDRAPSGGSEGTGEGGSIQQAIEPQTGGNHSGLGTVRGLVVATNGLAVAGARVVLVDVRAAFGGSNSTSTDGWGRFTFVDVPAGLHRLRTEKEGFKTLETSIEVQSSATTRIEVTLAPSQTLQGGEAWHRHDYWGPDTVKVFPSVHVGSVYCGTGSYGASPECSAIRFSIPPSDDPNFFRTILPGTSEVEVKISWDPAKDFNNRLGKVGLSFRDRHDPYPDNWSHLAVRNRDASFRIPVNWEMADLGHARISDWHFRLFLDRKNMNLPNGLVGGRFPFGPFEAQITLHRGVMPLEPPHEDFWGSSGLLTLVSGKTSNVQYSNWLPRTAIPPETASLEATLVQSNATLTPGPDWEFAYHPGPIPATVGADFRSCTLKTGDALVVATAPEHQGLVWKWKIDVKPGEADPFYSSKDSSRWCFFVRWPGFDDGLASPEYWTQYEAPYLAYHFTTGDPLVVGSPLYKPIHLDLTITATKGELRE